VAAVWELTNGELEACEAAAKELLTQTDPDILTPTLRAWLGALYGQLEGERQRREREDTGKVSRLPEPSWFDRSPGGPDIA